MQGIEIPSITTVRELANAIAKRAPKFSIGKYNFELTSDGFNTAEYECEKNLNIYFIREGMKILLGLEHGTGGAVFKSRHYGAFESKDLEELDRDAEPIFDKISPNSTLEFVIRASTPKTQ